jgi:hypothetical protein
VFKILFLEKESGSLYTYDSLGLDTATFDKVDQHGNKLNDYDLFPLYEIREALDAIADLVEACQPR